MRFFRRTNIKRFFALVTGIVFFNLSFFLTELSYIGLESKDKQMLVNLVRMLSGISEEETDAKTDSSHESHPVNKTVDLYHQYHYTHQNTPFMIAPDRDWGDMESHPLSGSLDSILQPPESLI